MARTQAIRLADKPPYPLAILPALLLFPLLFRFDPFHFFTGHVGQSRLKLAILLFEPSKFWGSVSPYPAILRHLEMT